MIVLGSGQHGNVAQPYYGRTVLCAGLVIDLLVLLGLSHLATLPLESQA